MFFACGLPSRADELSTQLKVFLKAEQPAERAAARKRILAIAGLDHRALDAALAKLDLWSDAPTPKSPLKLTLGEKETKTLNVHFALPADYAPTRAWPVIVALHGQGSSAGDMLSFMRKLLGAEAGRFILVAPSDIDGSGFSGTPDEEMRPRQLLVALRKRFHIDNDRVFIAGYSLGGQRTWLSATEHADCFAGAMPMAATLIVPGGDALYPDLLENLGNLAVLAVWGELDGPQPVPDHGDVGIVGGGRRIARIARGLGLEHFVGIERKAVGHVGATPPRKEWEPWLKRVRAHYPKAVHQTFRLAETSAAYWVRVQRLAGAPLPGREIRAPVRPGENPDLAMAVHIRKHVGCVEGRVKGQTIELRTQRSTFVDLLLHDDLIDLDRPITVVRNKSKAFEGKLERDLALTLDEAAATWDFERLPRAKLSVPLGGRAKPSKSK